MRRLFLILGVAALATSGGQAWATPPQLPQTSGEVGAVLTCFYECKRQEPLRRNLWKEVTTLMLTAAPVGGGGGATPVGVVFYDADENVIAATEVGLTPFDLDELYVCRTLLAGGARVPEKGLIEVALNPFVNGSNPVYGWIKNLVGKFNGSWPEPFRGREQEVKGIGMTECRVTPPSVRDPFDVFEAYENAPIFVQPRLIEGTGEPFDQN